jgi:DNA-binding response OmpR family regulator
MTDKKISQSDARPGASIQRQPNPRQRILVVEDDPLIRRVNTEVLTYSGYHVDAAADGAAAWDALQLNNYDLLVTDNHMPKVTGVELLQRILAANMTLPVIMATGAVPEEEFTRFPWLQPNLTLIKPYSFDELLAAVKEVLRVTSDGRNEVAPPPNWQIHPPADCLRL